jgi:hypothetical protein
MADRNEYHGYPESLYRIPLDGFLRPSRHLGLSFAFLVVHRISFLCLLCVRAKQVERMFVALPNLLMLILWMSSVVAPN